MTRDKQKNNAIEKALLILSVFKPYNDEMGTVEISQKLGFHKATVSRILQDLTKRRFLKQNPHTKKFSLGREILELSEAISLSLRSNLVDIALPFIKDLRDKVKETIIFVVLSEEAAHMIYILEGPQVIRRVGQVGERSPVHASAGGKAVLAFMPKERQKELLQGRLHRYTKNTITGKRALYLQLEEIRKTGIAFDRGEFVADASAIGAPIFNHEGRPVASLIITGPIHRISLKRNSPFAIQLKTAAAGISSQLHFDGRVER